MVLSVLLDAGAGGRWSYTERGDVDAAALPVQRHDSDGLLALLDQAAKGTRSAGPAADAAPASAAAPQAARGGIGTVSARSEGLGVASLRAFLAGVFSASKDDPLRADAATLKLVDPAVLRGVFQVTPANPMVGLEGRAGLISRLGEAVAAEAARSGLQARPGLLYDQLTAGGTRSEVSATEVLAAVLRLLSPIFTSGSRVQGLPAGDVWPHRWAGAAVGGGGSDRGTDGWVPFHKLGQWLSYSLLEPLQWAGVRVTGIDALTGLAEYRNGGLFIDCGVIVPRDPRDLSRTWKPGDEFIVEWRALTVCLLDELADARAPAPGQDGRGTAPGLHPRRRDLGRRPRACRRTARRRRTAAEDRQRRHGVLRPTSPAARPSCGAGVLPPSSPLPARPSPSSRRRSSSRPSSPLPSSPRWPGQPSSPRPS